MKDYYKTLNTLRTAGSDEIKKSFRALAKKYHPDANPNNAQAEAMFKEINEAYAVLGDEAKRAKYDASFSSGEKTGGEQGGQSRWDQSRRAQSRKSRDKASTPPDMSDINKTFEDFFGFSPKGGGSFDGGDGDVRPMKSKDAFEAIFGKGFRGAK
ncbi:MAG: DnaJ domain-containing protein [Clostridiales bacterium]|jgi:DnaJ-class molecular chaperone|nr:DnaJ domain-containing protein [Clostridiales bacterium]